MFQYSFFNNNYFYCYHSLNLQLSHLYENDGDHGLSKDVDVALWLDYRAYHNMQSLREERDFVILDFEFHEEFDEF